MKPMLAETYDGRDPSGWWMSEKLDGIRAIWNGKDFVSRTGKVFNVPDFFKKGMPDFVCDGELYMGRGKFQKTCSVVRKKIPVDAEWREVKYVIFERPELGIFEYCNNPEKIDYGYAISLRHVLCRGRIHLAEYFDKIVSNGGEGIMLRAPNSKYVEGRSDSLLKLKKLDDAEAEVIDYEIGKGKHAGRIGALVCRAFGKVFRLGSGLSDALRDKPPKIGSMVTFVFNGKTDDGLPRFPVFIGVRDYE